MRLVRRHGHPPRTQDGHRRLIERLTKDGPKKICAAEAKRRRRAERNRRVLERHHAEMAADQAARDNAIKRSLDAIRIVMGEMGYEPAT